MKTEKIDRLTAQDRARYQRRQARILKHCNIARDKTITSAAYRGKES